MNQRTSAARTSDWLMRAVKANPEGLFLLAAGAVLLMRKGGTLGRAIGGDRYAQAEATATKAVDGATEYVSRVAGHATEAAGVMGSSASSYAESVRSTASATSDRLMGQAHSTYQGTKDRVLREKPLLIALAGAAAGAAIAAVLPSSDLEKQAIGPIGAQMTEAASNVSESLKKAVGSAGEALKQAADERGLNPTGLKDVATEVAGAFGDGLKKETDHGPSGASSSTGTDQAVTG